VTATRLERLADLKRKENVQFSTKEPVENFLYRYVFNISRCEGYMDCVDVSSRRTTSTARKRPSTCESSRWSTAGLVLRTGHSCLPRYIRQKSLNLLSLVEAFL
jgi:hypothetical protein